VGTRRRSIPDPRVDPHDPNEKTPCESCRIDLPHTSACPRAGSRAHELEAEAMLRRKPKKSRG
jgi:hypothetical protein